MIPEEVRKEHMAICKKCKEREAVRRMVDFHVDWLDVETQKTGHAETANDGNPLTPTVWEVCSECKKPIDPWDMYCRSCGAKEPKKGRDCTDFIRWLMDEVMDEENWHLNAVANGEIICRKLKKLGLLDVVDGYYVETQKTGEWVKVIDEETSNVTKWHYECDQCRTGRYENGQRYCHNCGSKMLREDGEKE